MRNIKRIKKVLTYIEKNLKHWGQTTWHNECGTTHCFAGWGEIFAKGDKKKAGNYCMHNAEDTADIAQNYFNLTPDERAYFFNGDRTLDELKLGLSPILEFTDTGVSSASVVKLIKSKV